MESSIRLLQTHVLRLLASRRSLGFSLRQALSRVLALAMAASAAGCTKPELLRPQGSLLFDSTNRLVKRDGDRSWKVCRLAGIEGAINGRGLALIFGAGQFGLAPGSECDVVWARESHLDGLTTVFSSPTCRISVSLEGAQIRHLEAVTDSSVPSPQLACLYRGLFLANGYSGALSESDAALTVPSGRTHFAFDSFSYENVPAVVPYRLFLVGQECQTDELAPGTPRSEITNPHCFNAR